MNVEEYTPRRWFRITLDDGDSLKDSIREIAADQDVQFGWLQVLGEVDDPKLASGYEAADSTEKIFVEPGDNHHVLGTGSVSQSGDEWSVHLHGPMGRKGETTTGCWAGEQSVFRGCEVLLVELESTPA